MKKVIDGLLYANMIRAGAANLSANRSTVNDLNVFPIPDGDTGDNMYMTINSGASAFNDRSPSSVSESAKAVSREMLLGARGNSGVILSRIFSGISKGLENIGEADIAAFNKAMEYGVKEAYSSVTVPVEGTILTVYKDGVNYAAGRIGENSDLSGYFADLLSEMERSLDRTPDLLDVLKQAGVVDSGGAGLIYIVQGMKNAIDGEVFEKSHSDGSSLRTVDLSAFTENSVMTYGYCTEFLLRLQSAKTDIGAFVLDVLIKYLHSVGDSVVAFREDSIVKVHVHTMTPGTVLDHCQQYGEFLTLKIENMTLQHNETHAAKKYAPKAIKKRNKHAIVSVASGDGIKETFVSLGCDTVVDGGQSMNPSTEDFITAFDSVNADTVFVFPNNRNIIMTARQAADLYEGSDVRVIPTKTIGEGYAAISMFDPTGRSADEIAAELEEVISGVVTGMISKAVRDAVVEGARVVGGDYIGFVGDSVYSDAHDKNSAALELAERLGASNYDILILICGKDATDDEANDLCDRLEKMCKRADVIMINGGQPIYDYIMILE